MSFTSYLNTKDAARDIYENSPDIKGLTLRPWNRFDPANTLWWIVPSTDWPAHTFGKIVISREPDGGFFYGLVVEKGLDREAGAAYPGKKGRQLIMDDNWTWEDFSKDLKEGKLEKVILAINEKTSLPVTIKIDSAIINDPDTFDPYASSAPEDSGQWEYQKGELKEIIQPQGILLFLSGADSTKDLNEKITTNSEAKWFWIDFFVGVNLPNYKEENKASWDGFRIWKDVLYPLMPWLK